MLFDLLFFLQAWLRWQDPASQQQPAGLHRVLHTGEGRAGSGAGGQWQQGLREAKGDRLVQGLMPKLRNAAEQALRAFPSCPLLLLHSCASLTLHALLRGF